MGPGASSRLLHRPMIAGYALTFGVVVGDSPPERASTNCRQSQDREDPGAHDPAVVLRADQADQVIE